MSCTKRLHDIDHDVFWVDHIVGRPMITQGLRQLSEAHPFVIARLPTLRVLLPLASDPSRTRATLSAGLISNALEHCRDSSLISAVLPSLLESRHPSLPVLAATVTTRLNDDDLISLVPSVVPLLSAIFFFFWMVIRGGGP